MSGPKVELTKLKRHLDARAAALGEGTVFWRDVETDGVAYHAPFFSCFFDWLVAEFSKIGIGSSDSNKG